MKNKLIKPAVAIFIHEPLVIVRISHVNDPLPKDNISLKLENLSILRAMGIENIALVPICPHHAVSCYDAQFAEPVGNTMNKNIGAIKTQIKEQGFNLIEDYCQLFDSERDAFYPHYEKIEKQFESDEQSKNHPYRFLRLNNKDLITQSSLKALRLKVTCENYLNHLEDSSHNKFTNQKKEIVEKLLKLACIGTEDSIKDFRKFLNEKKPLLEARRDSALNLFLKVILTILSLGIAPLCGLWKVEGAKTVKDCEYALNLEMKLERNNTPVHLNDSRPL